MKRNFGCCFVAFFVLALSWQTVNADAVPVALRAVAVKGILKCGGKPAENVRVQLSRINSKAKTEVLESQTSGPSGVFQLNGNTNGQPINGTQLEPWLHVYHNCDENPVDSAKTDTKKPKKYRHFQLGIPAEMITLGRVAKKVYDVGELNLQFGLPGEIREKYDF